MANLSAEVKEEKEQKEGERCAIEISSQIPETTAPRLAWPCCGFPVTARSRNRSGESVLSKGPCITHRSSAAEDYTGWPLAQSSGAALAAARARCVAQSQSPQLKVSEQHR